MLVRRGLAVLSFAGVASWSGLAGAQYFHADPTVRLTGGYIFNRIIADDPRIDPHDQSGPLVTIGPSLLLTYDTPLVTQRLTISSTLGLPFASDFTFTARPPTYNLRLNYNCSTPLDALTSLTLTGSGAASPINDFSTLQDASLTPINAPPADFTAYNLSLTGTESIRRELTEDANLTQTTHVSYTFPFNVDTVRATTLTVKNSLAISRRWPIDTLSLTGSVGVTRFGPSETGGNVEARVQMLNDLSLSWRRPLTVSLSGSLQIGVGQTITPESTTGQVWQPTGGAQLHYDLAPAVITLAYNYSAVVDVYTATTNLNNQVTLRASLPISTTGLATSGSIGYLHTSPIGGVGVGVDAFTSDVGLTYSPIRVPTLSLSLRGTYARQVPLENPLGGVSRYGVSFNVGFSYPSTQAADVAARRAPAFIVTPNLDDNVILGQETPTFELSPPAAAPTTPPPAAAP